jgi:hypothetical protein
MSFRFIENPLWVAEVLSEPQAQAVRDHFAGQAKDQIISVDPEGDEGQWSTDGPNIVTDSSIWHIIEYGSVNNPPYAPIRRGVEAAGLKWVGS